MSRPTPLLAALALAAILLPAAAGHANHGASVSAPAPQTSARPLPLTAVGATVVAVPPGATETSAFLTLRNTGQTAVVLTGVRTPLARHAMLMTTRRDARGLTGMSAVNKLTVPAAGILKLGPDGDHLMLMDLARVPRVGEKVPLTLTTRDGRSLTVSAVVRRP